MPKITCLTIVYNAEKTLRRTIESVLAQTCADYEYIIVDHGSTDRTRGIIKDYEQRFPQIKGIYEEKNQGAMGILLHIRDQIEIAAGKWFITLDADDTYKPEAFQTMLSCAESHDLDMVCCGSDFIDQASGQQRGRRAIEQMMLLETPASFSDYLPFYHMFMRTWWGKLIKTDMLRQIDWSWTERDEIVDTRFAFECLSHCKKAAVLPGTLHHYYLSSDSAFGKLAKSVEGAVDLRIRGDRRINAFIKQFLWSKRGQITEPNEDFLMIVYMNALKDLTNVLFEARIPPEQKMAALHETYVCDDCRRLAQHKNVLGTYIGLPKSVKDCETLFSAVTNSLLPLASEKDPHMTQQIAEILAVFGEEYLQKLLDRFPQLQFAGAKSSGDDPECQNQRFQQALDAFEARRYQEAFSQLVRLYQEGFERQGIFNILSEAFYAPNAEEIQKRYEKNCAALKKYPYVWNKSFRSFEDLAVQLFPVSENVYYPYNREKDCFSEQYDAESRENMRYFFEDIDGPLRVKDEDNFYNLTFLNDNVRDSEDFAGDNHIYLLYSSPEPLERLMLACDLERLLERQKFVFLIGEKNWSKYPINFYKKYHINYAKMEPKPVRIEEIKRICFWYKHAHSGSTFALGVLGALSTVQMYSSEDFNVFSKWNGTPFVFAKEFRAVLSEPNRGWPMDQILNLIYSDTCSVKLENLEAYISWMRAQKEGSDVFTVKELFCGYFLFLYEKRGLNPRIAPMLLYDPHIWDPSIYDSIVKSFPYYTVLTCVREPIMRFARCYAVGIAGRNEFQTKYLLGMDYCNTQFLNPDFRSCYYGFRFEDIKAKPEAACRAICRHLNIPFEPAMLAAEAPKKDPRAGIVVKDWDKAAMRHDISDVLSEFDQLRLKMFYEPIHRYYGYPTFSFEEYPLPEKLVRELFQYPFRFEAYNHKVFPNAPPRANLHKWIQDVLQGMWRKKFTSPQLIPLEEAPDE